MLNTIYETERWSLSDPHNTRVFSIEAVEADGVPIHYYVGIRHGYKVEQLGFTPEEFNELVAILKAETGNN